MTKNIMIVGVGGQGTLLASKILGRLFLTKDYDVKVSEVHGMSQRGGSVVTYVRYGDKVYSPIVDKGEADVIISFELLEGARWIEYLSKDGVLVTNTQQINPMPVITGAAEYPEDIEGKLNAYMELTDANLEAIHTKLDDTASLADDNAARITDIELDIAERINPDLESLHSSIEYIMINYARADQHDDNT